jgi:hypothetical protein
MSDPDNDEIAWTITWSGDTPIAIIFSKEHAAQAARIAVETDLKSPLFLCVNLPKAALCVRKDEGGLARSRPTSRSCCGGATRGVSAFRSARN